MAQRARLSPVLGYNHNLRHGGRVFHVQTEDSGQGYARLHTHLFFEGTILSSKKQEYDRSAPEDAVRALMQQLHKSMIRELTRGEHDPRINAFFAARGEPAMLVAPASPPEVVEPAPVQAQPETAPAAKPAATPPPVVRAAPPQATPRPVVIVKPSTVKRPPVVLSSSADGVVVRRNVVINVGGGAPPVNGTPASAERAAPAAVRGRGAGAAPPIAAKDGTPAPTKTAPARAAI